MDLYSKEVERLFLSGLVKFQDVFTETGPKVSEDDFFVGQHKTIYSVIKNIYLTQREPNMILLGQDLKNMNITTIGNLDIFEYMKVLFDTPVSAHGALEAAKEIIDYRIRREIDVTAKKLQKEVREDKERTTDAVIADCDKIYNEKVSKYSTDDEPVIFFNGLVEELEEAKNKEEEEFSGIEPPYQKFVDYFGGFEDSNLYAFVSRSGEGKSTFLKYTGYQIAKHLNIPVLDLDTEMPFAQGRRRLIAGLTGVPLYHIKHGTYESHAAYKQAIDSFLKTDKDVKYYFNFIRNRPIHEIAATIRRWRYSVVGRDNPCLVMYDYIKLTENTKISKVWAEHQELGRIVDELKKLTEELECPILTSMQLNRAAENFGKKGSQVQSDSTVISMTDRLLWYTSYLGILRRKTFDEIAEDTTDRGTHKLITVKSREQGRLAQGHSNWVETKDGPKADFINFDIRNFRVEERGTYREMINERENKHNVQPDTVKNPTLF